MNAKLCSWNLAKLYFSISLFFFFFFNSTVFNCHHSSLSMRAGVINPRPPPQKKNLVLSESGAFQISKFNKKRVSAAIDAPWRMESETSPRSPLRWLVIIYYWKISDDEVQGFNPFGHYCWTTVTFYWNMIILFCLLTKFCKDVLCKNSLLLFLRYLKDRLCEWQSALSTLTIVRNYLKLSWCGLCEGSKFLTNQITLY